MKSQKISVAVLITRLQQRSMHTWQIKKKPSHSIPLYNNLIT